MSHILKSDDDATTMDKETMSAIIEDTKKEESTAEGSIIVETVSEEITEVKVKKRKEKQKELVATMQVVDVKREITAVSYGKKHHRHYLNRLMKH